jgi:hypothetical protein
VGYVVLRRMSEGGRGAAPAVDSLSPKDALAGAGPALQPGGLIREGVKAAGLFLDEGDTVATSLASARGVKTYLADNTGG